MPNRVFACLYNSMKRACMANKFEARMLEMNVRIGSREISRQENVSVVVWREKKEKMEKKGQNPMFRPAAPRLLTSSLFLI